VKSTKAVIIGCATTVDEALWLETQGVDAVVAQGLEAGGRGGMFLTDDISTQMGKFALLPQIVSAVKIPVLAAGGIADPNGVAAALTLGAVAVQIGTGYLRCPEATTSPLHRAALRGPSSRHTTITRLFSGRPTRGIVNRLIRELGAMNEVAPPFPLAATAVAPLRTKRKAWARAASRRSGAVKTPPAVSIFPLRI
jgi:nitronate monooxygenase